METGHPWTRAINSASGNRALLEQPLDFSNVDLSNYVSKT